MMIYVICVCLLHTSLAQRYADRNVPPAADAYPVANTNEYDDYGDYGFEEDEENVYKWNVEEYPHPRNRSKYCNRLKPSNVCDPDSVLTREHADILDSSIRKLYQDTPCICDTCASGEGGIVVGIALFKHMFQPYNEHPAKAIRRFAETLRAQWRLGKCDNDVLIVVATADRLSYTDVGEATSHYLSIHEVHRIFLENKANFTIGNFFAGLRDILEGYYDATRTMDREVGPREKKLNMPLILGAIVGSILLLGILLFLGLIVYKKYRTNKDSDDEDDYPEKRRNEGVASSWTKKDIRVLFGSEKQKQSQPTKTKYQPCQTEDATDAPNAANGEEVLDFTLASPSDTSFVDTPQVTNVTDSEELDKDLTAAAEGLVKTFPSPKTGSSVLMTDM